MSYVIFVANTLQKFYGEVSVTRVSFEIKVPQRSSYEPLNSQAFFSEFSSAQNGSWTDENGAILTNGMMSYVLCRGG